MIPTEKSRHRFGISLSGGGARGLAHIGVLAALEKYGIRPTIITGTSMGAIVGVFYAAGFTPDTMLEIALKSKVHKTLRWQLPWSGVLKMESLRELLKTSGIEDDFASLKKTFCCAVTNLSSGLVEIKENGPLHSWVLASASVPVIFEPVEVNGNIYVDGGLLNNMPASAIRDRCSFLIGVNVNPIRYQEKIEGMRNIAERCFHVGMGSQVIDELKHCNLIIEPEELLSYSAFEFSKAEEMYQAGYRETEKQIFNLFDSIELEQIIAGKAKRSGN
jgi:NTE family protein